MSDSGQDERKHVVRCNSFMTKTYAKCLPIKVYTIFTLQLYSIHLFLDEKRIVHTWKGRYIYTSYSTRIIQTVTGRITIPFSLIQHARMQL